MKKTILFLYIIGILTSCSNNNNDNPESSKLIGKWKLVEQLADPGDGSGVFVSVVSNKTIEFFDDGTVVSNGTLCDMNLNTGEETMGEYFATENYIKPNNDCIIPDFKISFELENTNLLLWFRCIEGCGQKFVRMD